ncbi:MAG: Sir2 family NAD-dependent protein deacetylase [Candidatus Nitrosopolaris sp.]
MIDTFEDTLKRAKKVVFLTGAGISQESGISTFRGTDGLWKKYYPMKLASAQAFRDNPKLVWSWYNDRRRKIMAKTKRGTSGHSKSAEPQRSLSNYSEYRWLTSEGRKQRGDRTSWKHLCN